MTKGTIIRTACLVLTGLNAVLAIFNKSPLPIDDATIELIVSFGFEFIASWVAWWKNNSFTPEAIEADKIMKKMKIAKKSGV
jgi:SPP1 family holin